MIKKGLIKEVKTLYDKGIKGNSVSAIGYKELYAYFDHKCTLDEAIDRIKQKSRNLAKKQITFFNNQFDITWLEVDLFDFDNTINKAIQILEK